MNALSSTGTPKGTSKVLQDKKPTFMATIATAADIDELRMKGIANVGLSTKG